MLFVSVPCAAAEAPPWLRRVLAGPSTGVEAASIVLFDETEVTVTDDGKLSTRRRYAVRVKSPEGRGAAALRHVYINPSGKVKEVRGWVVGSSGRVRELNDRQVVD